jgi:hypothetical protein
MRSFLFTVISFVTLALGVWSYNQNYATRSLLTQQKKINQQINLNSRRLALLKSEWLFLNRPSRIEYLANQNFESLLLHKLKGNQIR